MVTQEGNNVSVAAVKGNFDDAQTVLRRYLQTLIIKIFLTEINLSFHLQTSINWGRLVPQIVYYFSSYAELVKNTRN